ncbi:MAG: hypothetical protein H0T62_12035 [Parachlamydiaceae bacterium]|nr:hypothetical protein [Parachlamydiaceae bacterium]
MEKQSHKSFKKINDSSDVLDQHPFIAWIMEHGENILYTLLGAIILLFAAYMWFSGSSTRDVGDFKSAHEEFQAFQKLSASGDSLNESETLAKLTQILKQQPSLQAKYDGLIAQTLIERNEVAKALPFADSTFRRIGKDNLPFYIDYSEITLLIGQNRYNDAIKRSIALKENMLKILSSEKPAENQVVNQSTKESSFGEFLYAFNLLRIAFLQQYAGSPNEEIQSWKEWKEYTSPISMQYLGSSFDTKAFFTAAQLFNEGPLSLDYYIDERLQILALQEKK